MNKKILSIILILITLLSITSPYCMASTLEASDIFSQEEDFVNSSISTYSDSIAESEIESMSSKIALVIVFTIIPLYILFQLL